MKLGIPTVILAPERERVSLSLSHPLSVLSCLYIVDHEPLLLSQLHSFFISHCALLFRWDSLSHFQSFPAISLTLTHTWRRIWSLYHAGFELFDFISKGIYDFLVYYYQMLMLSSYLHYGQHNLWFEFWFISLIFWVRIYVRFNFFEVHYYLFSACVLLSLIDTVSSVSIKESRKFWDFIDDLIS